MRKLFLLLLIAVLFSCNNEEKYYGDWIYNWSTSIVDGEIPSRVKITKDSIKFRYPYFDYWSSFPVKLSRNNIEFGDFKFKTKFIADTLVLNQHLKFFKPKIKIVESEFLREDDIVDIDLPKLNYTFNKYNISNLTYLIRFGKRVDNSKYSLNLNDKYSEFKDLPRFLYVHHQKHEYNLSILLFCDKNARLKDFEKMLYRFQSSNKLKVSLVNNIILNTAKFEPFYSYETLDLNLPPMIERDSYFSTLLGYPLPPPPPVHPLLKKDSNYIIIKLIKNKIYINKREISTEELESFVKRNIKENKVIISLYDLESNYYSFMKMNGTINSCYEKLRNENALIKYNKTFDNLNIEEKKSIKEEVPVKRIWSFSIPHYNSLIKENGDFLGLKLEAIIP